MFSKLQKWVDQRWPLSKTVQQILDEKIPGGASFAYALGSATLIVFLLQAITGVWQMFFYVPTVDHAYESVDYLRTSVPFGWLVHGLHYWGASAMILLVGLHLARVFIWGAYKRPREITWLAGVFLLLFTMLMSFTGAPLPWDERGYWAAQVGTSIAGSIPLVGNTIMQVVLGGSSMGQLTLSRFFVLHVALVPGILLVILGIHLVSFRYSGSVGPWKESLRERMGSFWPDQLFKDAIVGAFIIFLLIGLASFFPPPFSGPADPVDASYVPKPEWNFLFLYEALKFFQGRLEPVGTVGIPLAGILLLILLPFVDRNPRRDPFKRPVAMLGGLIVGVSLISLTVAGYLSKPLSLQTAGKTEGLVSSSDGGSASVYKGQALFQSLGCIGCHSVMGSGGSAGPDLSNEASRGRSRQWLIQQIQNPMSHDPNTIMPAFSSLSSQEVNQLVDYLGTLGAGGTPPSPGPTNDTAVIATATLTSLPELQATASTLTPSTAIITPTPAGLDTPGTSAGGGPPGLAADMIGSASHGALLFTNTCAACHGQGGAGGVLNPGSEDGAVPDLNPIDPDFVNSNPQIFAENIDRIIQHGSVPPGSNSKLIMPAFGDKGTLTQQEIADIEAYVLQLNHVDRGQLIHPGLQPRQFFTITTLIFALTGLVLLIVWCFRR